jgi:hypothetical protein
MDKSMESCHKLSNQNEYLTANDFLRKKNGLSVECWELGEMS